MVKGMDEKLQKYVSDCGLMSRRAAEKEIELGNFEINGEKATIGDRVNPKTDIVKYKGKVIKQEKRKVYICLNKPVGYVTTMSDELGRKSINELISDVGQRVLFRSAKSGSAVSRESYGCKRSEPYL
jgi:23S rRNA pseudouridine2605 synthase